MFGEIALSSFALAVVLLIVRPLSLRLMTMESRRDRLTLEQARRLHSRGLLFLAGVSTLSFAASLFLD